jgi:hypothetical protein
MRNRRSPGSNGDVWSGGQQMFCGWDWGSTVHGVCLIDDHGAVVKRWMVQHTEDQLMNLFSELAQLVEGLMWDRYRSRSNAEKA